MRENVLFLCTGNSARSLMAEALLRDRAGDLFNVFSAGTRPRGVNPLAMRVLREIGVDVEGLRSKSVQEYIGILPVRYLIAVCSAAASACPRVWPGVPERLSWLVVDPARCEDTDEDPLERFREARDAIDERIADWLSQLHGIAVLPALVA